MSYLTDGFKTLITFSNNPAVEFREKDIQPPGMDAGGALDTTTMRNNRLRTAQPKKLVTMTGMKGTCQWDSHAYVSVRAMLGVNQQITVTLPDGHGATIWGWLDKFTPGTHKEGEFALADFEIVPSNQDNAGNEQDIIYF